MISTIFFPIFLHSEFYYRDQLLHYSISDDWFLLKILLSIRVIFVYFVFFILGTNQGETTVCSRKFTVAETHQKLQKKFKRRCRLWVTRKTPKTLLLVTCSLLWMNLRCIFMISLNEDIYRTLKNYYMLKH